MDGPDPRLSGARLIYRNEVPELPGNAWVVGRRDPYSGIAWTRLQSLKVPVRFWLPEL